MAAANSSIRKITLAKRGRTIDGKPLARRTGIAYEAVTVGEKAIIFKARYLYGHRGRIGGEHKRESHAHYPGRSVVLPWATAFERKRDGTAEVSRGHSRLLTGS